MSTAQQAPRQRFLDLLRRDILELDAVEPDYGIYRRLLQSDAADINRLMNHLIAAPPVAPAP